MTARHRPPPAAESYPTEPQADVVLLGFAEEIEDLRERFRVYAQSAAHPTELNGRTRQLLAALAGLAAADVAMQKALEAT